MVRWKAGAGRGSLGGCGVWTIPPERSAGGSIRGGPAARGPARGGAARGGPLAGRARGGAGGACRGRRRPAAPSRGGPSRGGPSAGGQASARGRPAAGRWPWAPRRRVTSSHFVSPCLGLSRNISAFWPKKVGGKVRYAAASHGRAAFAAGRGRGLSRGRACRTRARPFPCKAETL